MEAPKPRPSAGDFCCLGCGHRSEHDGSEIWYGLVQLKCGHRGETGSARALWGHEWAAVAWMAATQREYAESWNGSQVGMRQNTLLAMESACNCDENCPKDCLLCENDGRYIRDDARKRVAL